MDGLALPLSDLPLELIERYDLSRFVHQRGGEHEVRFLRQVRDAVLPVRHEGLLRIVSWGSRSGRLPRSGYTWLSTVESGEWTVYEAQEIEIPATTGLQNGVWFRIRQGVRGLLAEAGGAEAAYMIVEPSSYYYRIMTRAERMPVLLGERI
jgi:hypothetical protein